MVDLTTEYGVAERPLPPFPESREPGIWFSLPEEEYHADKSFSTSGIKHLLTSPMDYWARSWMNPEYEHEETSFTIEGTAWHKRILEGREAFYAGYAADIEASDHPDALRTMDDLREACKGRELKVGGNKADLVKRLQEADAGLEIWDVLVAEHRAANASKILLPFAVVKRIELQAAMIEKHPDISRCFSGGYPEVSVFWRDPETQCPMKARLDYVKIGADIDLKTFSNPYGKPIDRAIATAMAGGRYHVQCAVYTDAMLHAGWHIAAGRVFGDVDRDWCRRLAEADATQRQFVFVFQQTGIAPVARAKVFPRMLVYDCGKAAMEQAIRDYCAHLERYGSEPWVDTTPIGAFDDGDFPVWMTEA